MNTPNLAILLCSWKLETLFLKTEFADFGWKKLETEMRIISGAYDFSCSFNPVTIFLSWKYCLLCTSAAYIQVLFRLDFIMEAITMNPDQTFVKIMFIHLLITGSIFSRVIIHLSAVWIQIRTNALAPNCLQWLSADDKNRC